MKCPKCGSENVTVQAVTETKLVTKHHSFIWWCLVGCWWVPVKWCFFALPALIVKLFRPSRYKTKSKHISKCVCQNCGHMWNA